MSDHEEWKRCKILLVCKINIYFTKKFYGKLPHFIKYKYYQPHSQLPKNINTTPESQNMHFKSYKK